MVQLQVLDGSTVIEEVVCGFGCKEDMHQCVILGQLNMLNDTCVFTV